LHKPLAAPVEDTKAIGIHTTQVQISQPDNFPVTLGYAPWIEEVWFNYLSNALKNGGRPPRLEIGSTISADGSIKFWVKDNGAGALRASPARGACLALACCPCSPNAPARAGCFPRRSLTKIGAVCFSEFLSDKVTTQPPPLRAPQGRSKLLRR
jgi:hypothetical protein